MFFYTIQIREIREMDKRPRMLAEAVVLDSRKPEKGRVAEVLRRSADILEEICKRGK